MPRAKRPLAEADANACSKRVKSSDLDKTAGGSQAKKSHFILRDATTRYSAQPTRSTQEATGDPMTESNSNIDVDNSEPMDERKKEDISYTTKDNSKLRCLLNDRWLSTQGTRAELIKRLQNSSISYDDLPASDVTDILSRRHATMAARFGKEVRIERIRLNDMLDRDTGNSDEAVLYGRLSAYEWIVGEDVSRRQNGEFDSNKYAEWPVAKLRRELGKRNLNVEGQEKVLSARLCKHEKTKFENCAKENLARYQKLKAELEERVGHPVASVAEQFNIESEQESRDYKVQQRAAEAAPKPKSLCDYKWKDSRWASKTERELHTICESRGMEGWGRKATLIKWLDTGSVEYEEMNITGLESICRNRGIETKSREKRLDLVRRLKEADEVGE